jgi:hypothetical protein
MPTGIRGLRLEVEPQHFFPKLCNITKLTGYDTILSDHTLHLLKIHRKSPQLRQDALKQYLSVVKNAGKTTYV